ncbi:ribosomal RNA adenine dimethylase family protein [Perkinsela sp. CCAP 1560/4]|nr:ribosomal RNA adenine dimethylase family protein [Perkinsela sp. CCAP 1560/4]KNH07589.1 ribosomal RNA adenine dimethylase family protein [Perkinsela sp. CCAP 1560/4]|eukprot:KNH05242.1 ribosomal RNA adenine dimethylase family protein [Perkinsela sp. CCAP 1560/4]
MKRTLEGTGRSSKRHKGTRTREVEVSNPSNARGIQFRKAHGQHILRNFSVLRAIVDKSGILPTDVVLEIGPGTGNLTEYLLKVAKKVVCIEVDERMVGELKKKFEKDIIKHKLQIIQGNCLRVDFPHFDRCVANVPYNISSAIVFKLLRGNPQFHVAGKHGGQFKCAILMFQREFAMRLVAQPGDTAYSRLSINSQLLAKISHVMKVNRNSFVPPPKVESSVVRLEPKHPAPNIDFQEWDELAKLIFNRKNRKVSSIFSSKRIRATLFQKHLSQSEMNGKTPMDKEAFSAAIVDVTKNAEFCDMRSRSMPIDNIALLLSTFHEKGIFFT